jgi:periplasmic divalent cation tolerance protein
MTEYIIAVTTTPPEEAQNLASILVKSKACACVNILEKVTSVYHWKGKIETESECILFIKTEAGKESTLWEIIKKNHPYDLPELITIPIQWGKSEYLKWISEWVS